MRKYEEAIKDYNKAIELNPNYASAFNNRGSTFNRMGKYEEAIKDYNTALSYLPNDPLYLFNLAKCLQLKGHH